MLILLANNLNLSREGQAELQKQFGMRFVYNRYLAMRMEDYLAHKDDPQKKGLNYYDTAAQRKELRNNLNMLG